MKYNLAKTLKIKSLMSFIYKDVFKELSEMVKQFIFFLIFSFITKNTGLP